MRRGTDPIEPGHVSIEIRFLLYLSVGWQTRVSPLEMTLCAWGHSKGSSGLCEWP